MLSQIVRFFALVLLFSACQGKLATIVVSDEIPLQIPPFIPELHPGDIGALDVKVEFENPGLQEGDIADARLRELALVITDPERGDLTWIKSLEIYIETEEEAPVLIASRYSFAPGSSVAVLDLEDVDLAPYIVGETIRIVPDITAVSPGYSLDIDVLFTIGVGITSQGCSNRKEILENE